MCFREVIQLVRRIRLGKNPYQEEEVKQILQALFLEKKKVRQQEEQIKTLQTDLEKATSQSDNAENVQRLENLLAFFKAKYEQAARALTERPPVPVSSVGEEEYAALQEQLSQLRLSNQQQQQDLAEKDHQLHLAQEALHELRSMKEEWEASTYEQKIAREELFERLHKWEQQFVEETEKVKEEREKCEALTIEQEQLLASLQESKQHSEQLERVIQFLRERSEETHLELNQFKGDYQTALQEIETLRDAFGKAQADWDAQYRQQQEEQKQHAETVEELIALQEQLASLRSLLAASETRAVENHNRWQASEEALAHANSEIHYLQQALAEVKAIVNDVEAENQQQKEQLAQQLQLVELGNQRAALFENEKSKLVEELENALQQIEILRTELEHTQEELQVFQKKEEALNNTLEMTCHELAAAREEMAQTFMNEKGHLLERIAKLEEVEREVYAHQLQREEFQNRHTEMEKALQDSQQMIEELHQARQIDQDLMKLKEDSLDALQGQLRMTIAEKESIEESLRAANQNYEEAESRLKIAQQHLARKVKEVNEQLEQLDHLKVQVNESHAQLNQARVQIGEMKTVLETQSLQDKRLQEQLQENARAAEVAINRLEEKYFKAYEKWQEAEGRIRELKKLEEKYNQMQAWLANLGSLIGNSPTNLPPTQNALSPLLSPEPPHSPLEPPEVHLYGSGAQIEEKTSSGETGRHFQNLFNIPRIHDD